MKDCIFCQIVSNKIASTKVYEDKHYVAFFDLYPASKGHLLVIPKRHFSDIFEIEEKELEGLGDAVKKVSIALRKALKCDGINLVQNNGAAAGQIVMHAHFHLIPRYEKDGLELHWMRQEYAPGELEQLQKKIIGALK